MSNEIDRLRKENAQLESACAELKQFISQCEMPMRESFSDADSIAWRKKREYLLSNKAGEQLQAKCAVMREALEYCGCHEHSESPCDESGSHYKGLCEFCKRVDDALSTDCGASIPERLKELESSRDAWIERSNTFEREFNKIRESLDERDTALVAAKVALEAYVDAVTDHEVFFALGGTPTEKLKQAGALHKVALHQIDAVLPKSKEGE